MARHGLPAAAAVRLERVAKAINPAHLEPGGQVAFQPPAVSPSVPAQAEGPTGSTVFGNWAESQLLRGDAAERAAVLAVWRGRRAAMASAMYPPCMGHERSEMPCLWTAEEWAAAEAQLSEPIFDAAEFEAQMAAQDGAFERDGYVVLRSVMTADATRQWTEAMLRSQELNDNLVRAARDWHNLIDWDGLGWDSPALPESPTEQVIATAIGSGQRFKPQTAANGILLLRLHGVLPEYCPPAHSGYLMRCLMHPDMLGLHRRCLGTDDVYMDNCQSNNKAAPQTGGPWHVHGTGAAGSGRYGETCDDVGPLTDPVEYMKQP